MNLLRNVAISSFPSPKVFLLFPALFLFPAQEAYLSHQSIQQANLAHWILWCDISIFFIFFAGCALFASCTFCVVCAFIARLRSSNANNASILFLKMFIVPSISNFFLMKSKEVLVIFFWRYVHFSFLRKPWFFSFFRSAAFLLPGCKMRIWMWYVVINEAVSMRPFHIGLAVGITKKKKKGAKKGAKKGGRFRESNPGLIHPKDEFYH